jgi:hypothetical protein
MKTRVIPLNPNEILKEDPFPDKVSLEQLHKIWDDERYTYTDDELMRIREWLYAIAAIAIRLEKEKIVASMQAPVTIPMTGLSKAS